MKRRMFENCRWLTMAMLVAVALTVFSGVLRAMAAPEDAPQAALRSVAWNAAGITTDTNSSANLSQNYSYHDLFCSVDLHTTGQVIITVQASPAGTTYYDSYDFPAITSDTDVFTRVLSYGKYERLNFDVSNTNLITPTCTSIYFNNWYPSNYAQ